MLVYYPRAGVKIRCGDCQTITC
ncbi:MAG: hypothetical protein ACFFD4_10510 [Candidatus Odinarchaeota archaeon]